MNIRDIVGGILPTRRPFASETDIKTFLQDRYGDPSEKFLEARALLIFWGPTQKTWLVATNKALYCVFDISKEDKPRIKWRILVEQMKDGLPIWVQDYSERTGYVIIDSKNRRKYSRRLFATRPIRDAIRVVLEESTGIATVSAA